MKTSIHNRFFQTTTWRAIKAKAPSEYMKKFKGENEELKNTMKSHLINLPEDGIWENDYEKFYYSRLKRIVKELNKMILISENQETKLEVYEDIEEPIN